MRDEDLGANSPVIEAPFFSPYRSELFSERLVSPARCPPALLLGGLNDAGAVDPELDAVPLLRGALAFGGRAGQGPLVGRDFRRLENATDWEGPP